MNLVPTADIDTLRFWKMMLTSDHDYHNPISNPVVIWMTTQASSISTWSMYDGGVFPEDRIALLIAPGPRTGTFHMRACLLCYIFEEP